MRTLKLLLIFFLALASVGVLAWSSRRSTADSDDRRLSALSPSDAGQASTIGGRSQVRVEDQLRAVLTRLLREAPTRFAVLRGDRIQVKVHKSIITGSRSIILTEHPGPIAGDAMIFDFPPSPDFPNGSSTHHLRYIPSNVTAQSELSRLERVIDVIVPKDWARGGRGASKERPRWGVECAPNIRNGFEVVLDSRPGDQMGLVSPPSGPAIDIEMMVIPCPT